MAREERQTVLMQPEALSGKHKILIIALCAVIILSLIAHVILRPDRNATLKIVYTGNLRGQIEYNAGNYAGYEKIAAIVQKEEANGHVLLLNTGDDLAGNEAAEVDEGSSMIAAMNAVGYTAMVPGNADFIYGTSALSSLRAEARFPFLAANIKKADGSNVFENYQVLNINNVRIGVIGVTTGLSENQASKESMTAEDPVASVETVMNRIGGRTDAVIILAYTNDEKLISELASVDGVSLVIASGGVETSEKTVEDDKMVLSAGERGRTVGVATLDIKRGEVSVSNAFYGPESYDSLRSDAQITQTLTAVRQNKTSADAMQIGSVTIAEDMSSDDDSEVSQEGLHNYETAIGDLVTDAMLAAAASDGAEIALIRDTSIHGTLTTGAVTRGQAAALFDDNLYMVTCKMTGGELRAMLEDSFNDYPNAEMFLQVSGVSYTYDPATELGSSLSEMTVGAHSLDDARTYIVAMPNTLADELGYGSTLNGRVGSYKTITSILVDYIHNKDRNGSTEESEDTAGADETEPDKRINIYE